jgi:oligoendopeptidase F
MVLASIGWAEDTGAIPQRSEIDDEFKWKTQDLYQSLDEWEADYTLLDSRVQDLKAFEGRLGEGPDNLLGCLKLSDSLDVIISNLYVYAYLRLDEDGRVSEFQELGGRASGLNSRLAAAQSFMAPEVLLLNEEKLDGYFRQEPALSEYKFYLDDQMRRKEHILSPSEENLIALAASSTGASRKTFNMVESADLKLGTVVDPDGNEVELTWGRYSNIMKNPDRDYRSRANDTVQASYKRYINTLSSTLSGSLNTDWFMAQARGYETCLDNSLDNHNIPVPVFHALIDAVNANLAPLQKFTSMRKKFLGFDTLYTYDLSVPLLPEFDKKFTYEEACEMVLEGLKPLGDDYLRDLEMGLNSGWIDVYENEGKGTGAYSWGTYTSHPYVLLNFSGQLRDVFTIAHEMGHALNSYYTNQNEPYAYHGHSLFTAEVASTFNEALILKYLLEKSESKEEKMMLLNYYLEQIEGTFFTQVMFSEFELAIHETVQSGGAFSVDYFRRTYRDIFQKYHGADLVIGPDNDMGGMKISHFYRQYYVYQYATCYAAAQMLSQKVLEGDKQALAAYKKFLATGSSMYPVDILKEAGVDMTTAEPVERTIKLFGDLVDEMEQLLLDES